VSRDLVQLFRERIGFVQGTTGYVPGAPPKGGVGCNPAASPPSQSKFKKNTNFVGTVIPNVLRDLPSSRNWPLKWADDQYNIILKNVTESIGVS